jgi:type IV pilus assembly protein PilB
MQIKKDQLKKFIIESNLVARNDIDEAERLALEKETNIGDELVGLGKLKHSDLKRIQAYVVGIPFISLIGEKIDPNILLLIPEPIARNYNIIAYKRHGDELEAAMLDFDDLPRLDFIRKKVGLKILPRLTDVASIKAGLAQYKQSLKADFDAILQKETESLKTIAEATGEEPKTEKELKEMAEDIPVVKIVDTLISHAILQNASDIHIEPQEESLVVRYRIDGILHDAMILPKETSAGIIARIKVLSNLKLDEKRLPQDGRFKINNDEQRVSFRVSTLPIYYGEKTVIRILRENAKGFSLEGLGFHGSGLERIHDSLKLKTGMILATGPTGSGKTTTLYTLLDILNTPDVNISTVEDPIEYQMPRINQTQVKSEIGLTFANGLRTLLRQDPDILMVGEIRDGETVDLAINASLTGHLVLSTIHTNSAAGAIPRMIDMGAEAFLIISTVRTIIAQRLVRKLCHAREEYIMEEAEYNSLAKIADMDHVLEALKADKIVEKNATWKTIPFYRPVPSEDCENGYSGRIGIHEVLTVSSAIKELILKGSSEDVIAAQARKEGMLTMLEDGIFQAAQGLTTTAEVLRVVSE